MVKTEGWGIRREGDGDWGGGVGCHIETEKNEKYHHTCYATFPFTNAIWRLSVFVNQKGINT